MKKPNFDLRKGMTGQQWQEVEDYYIEETSAIEIPDDLNPATLAGLNADVAKLFTQARFDYAFIKRQYEKIKRQFKRAEKQAYMAIKDMGKNDKEREGLINKYLEDNKVFNHPVTIYDAVDIYEDRVLFMEAVIDDIREKGNRIVTFNAALKLDADATRQGA
ncbi:hypothetical protein D3C85_765720 [compost metagenome]